MTALNVSPVQKVKGKTGECTNELLIFALKSPLVSKKQKKKVENQVFLQMFVLLMLSP